MLQIIIDWFTAVIKIEILKFMESQIAKLFL